MTVDAATRRYRRHWPLSPVEVAHALPVLRSVHPGLRSVPAPRLAAMRPLAARWGVRDGTLRTALSRACASGSLEAVDGRYRLGPVSIEAAHAARSLLDRRRGYVLALIVEGEHHDSAALRALLTRFGLRPLQRSAWIGARTGDDRLVSALGHAGLHEVVTVFQCDDVDAATSGRLLQLWQLDARAKDLRTFQDQIDGYVVAAGRDRREAGWRCIEITPVWYRVALLDEPPFPLDLLPDDYPLEALRGGWRERLASMTDVLAELCTDELTDPPSVATRTARTRR